MRLSSDISASHTVSAFTLVELVVVLGILALISVMVIAGSGGRRQEILLQQEGYRVATFLRSAQVYGVGVKEAPAGFDAAFGVYAKPGEPLVLFSDTDSSGTYDPAQDDLLEQLALPEPFHVLDVCAFQAASGGWRCGPTNNVQAVHVTFRRPNPEAVIRATPSNTEYSRARVVIGIPNTNSFAQIDTYLTGYIGVAFESSF